MSAEDFLENIDGTEEPLRKIKRRAMRNVLERVSDFGYDCGGRGDTPIERMLFAALRAEIQIGCHEHEVIEMPMRGVDADFSREEFRHTPFCLCLTVESQKQLDGWCVDFLISTPCADGPRAFLIVECDGHDFHERTKAQAAKDRARDRKFQDDGYTVYRFTGSEIWRDPCGCADQIIDWAVEKACF